MRFRLVISSLAAVLGCAAVLAGPASAYEETCVDGTRYCVSYDEQAGSCVGTLAAGTYVCVLGEQDACVRTSCVDGATEAVYGLAEAALQTARPVVQTVYEIRRDGVCIPETGDEPICVYP